MLLRWTATVTATAMGDIVSGMRVEGMVAGGSALARVA